MTNGTRQQNQRLYGRRHIPRSDRRVMLALLAASEQYVYPLSKLAQVGSGRVYIVLARMELQGWVDRQRESSGRFSYTLNPKGRACVTILLGLPAESLKDEA